MKIAIDCMGGDGGVAVMVAGAVTAAARFPDLEIILVGHQGALEMALKQYPSNLNISIKGTTEVILNDEQPTWAIRTKKDASMVVAARMVVNNEADAMLTSGSTGAYLASGVLLIGRMPGIRRPGLTAIAPNFEDSSKPILLLDVGANMDAVAEDLVNYAVMGKVYAENVLNRKNPKVGLLNVGAEEGKGNSVVKEAYEALTQKDINFVGNIEARDVFIGKADVIVSDGFAGNVLVKSFEGAGVIMLNKLKQMMMANLRSKIGGSLLRGGLSNLKQEVDYNKYGGAMLLGIKGLAIKCHGSANAIAVTEAISQAVTLHKCQVIDVIAAEL